MRRVIVLGGLGQFGRIAAEQVRRFHLPVLTAARRCGGDFIANADNAAMLRDSFRAGDIVLDAAGPFQARSTALIETAIEIGFDVIDINDGLRYAEAVLSLKPRIDAAGIRVLSSASSVSAVGAAVVRQSGIMAPRDVRAFLVPAAARTSSVGAALSLVQSVGQPVRVFCDGRLQERLGWSEPRDSSMPPPLGRVCGRLFESADAVYLPRIFPSLRFVAMHVDTHVPGANRLLRLAAASDALRHWIERHIDWCAWIARRFGSPAGGVGYEIESANGEVARYALVAEKNSFLAAIAPAVLAVRAIAENRFPHRGLVLPDRHVEPRELFAFLESVGMKPQRCG